ncbi:Acyl-CoA oxidase C-terminal, partial [Trinorchestia longiramus]
MVLPCQARPFISVRRARFALPAMLARFALPAMLARFALPAMLARFALPAMLARFALPASYVRFALPASVWRYCRRWLECVVRELCCLTAADATALSSAGAFTVRNHTQVYRGQPLAMAYFHVVMLQWYEKLLENCTDAILRQVLGRLCALYGVTRVLQFTQFSHQPLAAGLVRCLQDHAVRLCSELRPDAVALVDVVAPPDFFLNSVLGREDGR